MGVMHYYYIADLVRTRVHEAACSVFKVRYLNNQIIYNNLSGFMRRKTVVRKADAIQKFSIIQKMEWYQKQGTTPDLESVKKEVKMAEETLKAAKKHPTELLIDYLKRLNHARDVDLVRKGFEKPDYGDYLNEAEILANLNKKRREVKTSMSETNKEKEPENKPKKSNEESRGSNLSDRSDQSNVSTKSTDNKKSSKGRRKRRHSSKVVK